MTELAVLGARERLSYVSKRLRGKFIDIPTEKIIKTAKSAVATLYLASGRPPPVGLRSFYILKGYRRANRQYVPRSYSGRVILFQRKERSNVGASDWNNLVGGTLEIHEVPGNHTNVTKEPDIGVWARVLRSALETAQSSAAVAEKPILPSTASRETSDDRTGVGIGNN